MKDFDKLVEVLRHSLRAFGLYEGYNEKDRKKIDYMLRQSMQKAREAILEEIVEKASHSFHPYCPENCYEKLKKISSKLKGEK
jgi:hypothetical protein